MNSNVIFQISTVVLALALAAVLIVVFAMPEEEKGYVEPVGNDGLIEIDEFDIVDESTGSSAKGRIYVINDGEFKVKLMADITVAEEDYSGFEVRIWGAAAEDFYCEFNGDAEEDSGWYILAYRPYDRSPRDDIRCGSTEIVVDSCYLDVTPRRGPGSGTLVADFKLAPGTNIDEIDAVECFIGIGPFHSANERFFLPTKDLDKEEQGVKRNKNESVDVKISDPIDPLTIRFEDPGFVLELSPVLTANADGSLTLVPGLVIPADQGKFRKLIFEFGVDDSTAYDVIGATYTDFGSLDPGAYSYKTQYYLNKGSKIESDELSFTDSRTFTFDKTRDKVTSAVTMTVGICQDGRVNTFSARIAFNLSQSGVFYDVVYYEQTERMEKEPTYEEMLDFKSKVQSGAVVRVKGDFTDISKMADLDIEPGRYMTAIVLHDGEYHSKTFWDYSSYVRDFDPWAISVLGGGRAESASAGRRRKG